MNRKVLFLTITFSLLFSIALFTCVQVLTVQALVPSIMSLDFREVGSTVWVDIVISHEPPPAIGSSHYVSNVQLEINEVLTDLTQTPQSSTTFTIEHELGSNTNSYSVRARALCNLHGYSGWSAIATYLPPSPTPTPTSTPSETPTPSASPTSPPEPTEPPALFPQEALYAIAIVVIGVAFAAVILILRKRNK
jgi:desulfoferrodoxin (superoxide reductase-like protein)